MKIGLISDSHVPAATRRVPEQVFRAFEGVELILHADQRYDLAVADEVYENRPIESFDWIVPFANAVADGEIVQRRWISRLTGLERSVETVVMLGGGAIWREGRGELPSRMPTLDDDGTELREKRFLPYRR